MSCDTNHKCPRMYLLFAALFESLHISRLLALFPFEPRVLCLYSLQAISPMALSQAVTGFRSAPFTSVKGLRRPLGGKTTIAGYRTTPLCVCIAHSALHRIPLLDLGLMHRNVPVGRCTLRP